MKPSRLVAILNPAARHGRAQRAIPDISSRLRAIQPDMPILFTRGPGHAVELAREAAANADVVVAIGGDGTLHEVANGLLTSGSDAALGIVPFGTGNDYVKMTKTPRDPGAAINILEKGERKPVDCGLLEYKMESEKGRRYFINTAGIGLDAEVSARASSFKALPGFSAYLAALLSTLGHLSVSESELVVEDEGQTVVMYRGALLLCSFGNGQFSGGLFRLTPAAEIDDGWLDICAVERLSVPRILRYIPRVLRGTHTTLPECRMARVRRLSVSVSPGMYVHADGEIVARQAGCLEVRLVRRGLAIIGP